ncbi:MAG: hypothetical protein R3C46_10465 [Hyphomonadaceae bacterium]
MHNRKTLMGVVAATLAIVAMPAIAQPAPAAIGAWDTTIEAGGGVVFEATITFRKTGDDYAVDFLDDDPAAHDLKQKIYDVKLTGAKFSFRRTIDFSTLGGEVLEVLYEGEVDGDHLTGSATSAYGPSLMTATRLQQ